MRLMLIAPDGALNPRTGGGQRTRHVFEAMKALGAVDVVVVNAGARDPSVFFPGAASVRLVRGGLFGRELPESALGRLTYRARRAASLRRFLGRDAVTAAGVARILHEVAPDAIVARYFKSAYAAGVLEQSPAPVLIDLDDRDDRKLAALKKGLLSRPIVAQLYDALVVDRAHRVLMEAYGGAAHLFVAAEEDLEGLERFETSILENIPAQLPDAPLPPGTDPKRILFVGTAGHVPNSEGVRWFIRDVWPLILQDVPGASFAVAGIGDWRSKLGILADGPGVDVVGFVKDIEDAYRPASLAVSPVDQGAGSKIKVLEAMAFGRAVVATPHSLRGFTREVVAAAASAANAKEFAERCVEFLRDSDRRSAAAAEGLGAVRAGYSRAAFEGALRRAVLSHVEGDVRADRA